MQSKIRQKVSLARDTRGLSTVEYVILLALVAILAIASWQTFGKKVKSAVDTASGEFSDKVPGANSGSGGSGSTP